MMISEEDDMLQLRSRLLEGGRSEVGGILSDITSKYNAAVYHRDVEIGNLRRYIESLEQRLEIERDERLQERVREQADRNGLDTQNALHQTTLNTKESMIRTLEARNKIAEESLSTFKTKYNSLKRTSKDVSQVLKQATGSADHLGVEVDRLTKALAASKSETAKERKRADQLHNALKDAEGDAVSLEAKIALIQKESTPKTAPDQTLREGLRLQIQNTKRLLQVLQYIGTLSKADQFREVANISRSMQVLGTSFQYVPSSAEEGPHAGVLQDLKAAVSEYHCGVQLVGRGVEEGDAFRHLHIEMDRWIPQEVVGVVRKFHNRYFPRSSPQIFYRLAVDIASTIRSLSNMSPVDNMMKRSAAEERSAAARFGCHDNRFNAPQQLCGGGGGSLDYTKESGPRQSSGEYFYSAKVVGGDSAADVCLRDCVSKAWEGVRLLQGQLSPSGDKTCVSLQPSTVDNICTMASRAFTQVFAKMNGPVHSCNVPVPLPLTTDRCDISSACSQLLSLFQGVRDSATHCDDKLAAVIADVESQRCTLHSTGRSSPEYTLLKHQVRQTVGRYLNEIRTLVRAAHTTTLELRSAATH